MFVSKIEERVMRSLNAWSRISDYFELYFFTFSTLIMLSLLVVSNSCFHIFKLVGAVFYSWWIILLISSTFYKTIMFFMSLSFAKILLFFIWFFFYYIYCVIYVWGHQVRFSIMKVLYVLLSTDRLFYNRFLWQIFYFLSNIIVIF